MMGKNSDITNIISHLPENIFIDLTELVPELVLLKMGIGESFSIGKRRVTLTKVSKYAGKNDYIVVTGKIDIGGDSKQIFIWRIGNTYQLHGTSGRSKKHDWVHNLLRDIEGQIICDMINLNNLFHEFSDVFKIYTR